MRTDRNNEAFHATYKNVLPEHPKDHGKRYLQDYALIVLRLN